MFWRRTGSPSFMDKIAQRCEYLLVEAADRRAETESWSLTSRIGKRYRARLIVDEWTDCPVVEVAEPESGEVVQRFGIKLSCWPLR